MKVSAINTTASVHFQGENSKKCNNIKNTAGAAMIVLAAAVPVQEAKAQYFTPPPPAFHQYYVPSVAMNVPKCFIYGDETNENYEKTMSDVFNEIDKEIEQNGQISVNEVVHLEANNYNSSHTYPMTRGDKIRTANLVKEISKKYNENNSNPNTINYNEYKTIMNDFMKSKNIAEFISLLQIYSNWQRHPHRRFPGNSGNPVILPPPSRW